MKRILVSFLLVLFAASAFAAVPSQRQAAAWSGVRSNAAVAVDPSSNIRDANTEAVIAGSSGSIPVDPCDGNTIKAEMNKQVSDRQTIADNQFKKAMDLSCLDKYKNLNIAGSFGVFDASRFVSALRDQVCKAADRAFSSVAAPVSTGVWAATGGAGGVRVTPSGNSNSTPGISGSTSTYNSSYGVQVPNLFQ